MLYKLHDGLLCEDGPAVGAPGVMLQGQVGRWLMYIYELEFELVYSAQHKFNNQWILIEGICFIFIFIYTLHTHWMEWDCLTCYVHSCLQSLAVI